MVYLLMTHRVEPLLLYLMAVLFFFRLSELSVKLALRNLRPFLVLFLLTFFFHAVFTDGKILWKVPFVSVFITEEGIYQAIFYTFRIGILVVLASLLTLTTSPMSLTDGIERFLTPFRRMGVPAHEIAMMFSISLRFIPILIDETERIRKAQVSRGGCFEGNIFRRIRSIVPVVVPLFLSTFRRANDLALAMDARCYRGGVARTSYHVLRFHREDILALLVVILLGIPVVFLR